jgi:hypothetical protein
MSCMLMTSMSDMLISSMSCMLMTSMSDMLIY